MANPTILPPPMTESEPSWLLVARQHIGLREIGGLKHNPIITEWLIKLKAWWRDDETPWCGVFVAAMLEKCGYEIPRHYYRARAWADWGEPCSIQTGAVVVLERSGGGHVGFCVGVQLKGGTVTYVNLLGGNQDNGVNVRAYPIERVIAIRKPANTFLSRAEMQQAVSGKTEA